MNPDNLSGEKKKNKDFNENEDEDEFISCPASDEEEEENYSLAFDKIHEGIKNKIRLHEENGKINSESHRDEDEKDIEIDEDVKSDGEASEEDEGLPEENGKINKFSIDGETINDNGSEDDLESDGETSEEDERSITASIDLCEDKHKNLPIDQINKNNSCNEINEEVDEKHIVKNTVYIENEVRFHEENGKIISESHRGEDEKNIEIDEDVESDGETSKEDEGSITASNDLCDEDVISDSESSEEDEGSITDDNESENDIESDGETSEEDEGNNTASNDLCEDKNKNLPIDQLIKNNSCNEINEKVDEKHIVKNTVYLENEVRLHEENGKIISESHKGEDEKDIEIDEDVESDGETSEEDEGSITASNDLCDEDVISDSGSSEEDKGIITASNNLCEDKIKNLPIDQIIKNSFNEINETVDEKYIVKNTVDIENEVRLHEENGKINSESHRDEDKKDIEIDEDVHGETSEEDEGSINASNDLCEDKNKNLPIDQLIKNNSCNEINEKVDDKHIVKKTVYIENEVRLHEENGKINSESHRVEDEKDIEIDEDVESDGETSGEDEGSITASNDLCDEDVISDSESSEDDEGSITDDNESENDLESDGETSEEDEGNNTASNDLCDRNVLSDSERSEEDKEIITASNDLCEDKIKNLPIDQLIKNSCNEIKEKVDEKHIVKNTVDIENEVRLHEENGKINSESHRYEDKKDIEIDEDVESDGETSEEDEGSINASIDLCEDKNKNLAIDQIIKNNSCNEINEKVDDKHIVKNTVYMENEVRLHEENGKINSESHRGEDEKDIEIDEDVESDGETSEEDEGSITDDNESENDLESDGETSEEDEGNNTASNDLCDRNVISDSERSEEDKGIITASNDLCEDKIKNLPIDQLIKNSCNEIKEKVDEKHIVKITVDIENEVRLHEENGKINSESHRYEDKKDIEIDEDVESDGETSEEDEGSINASIDLCEDKNKNLAIDQIIKNNSCNEINEKVDDKHIVKNTVYMENEVRLHEENGKINSESHRGEDEKDIEIDEDVESDGETSEEDEGNITDDNESENDLESDGETSEEDEGNNTASNDLCDRNVISDSERSEEDKGIITASNDLCEDKIKNLPIDQLIKNSCNEIKEKVDEKHIVKNTVDIENEVRLHEENGKINSESHRYEDKKDKEIDEDVESDGETSEEDEGSITASIDLCEDKNKNLPIDQIIKNNSCNEINEKVDEKHIVKKTVYIENEVRLHEENGKINSESHRYEDKKDIEIDEDVESDGETSEEDEGSINASIDLCEDKNKNLAIDQIIKNNSCNEINEKVDDKHIVKNTVYMENEVRLHEENGKINSESHRGEDEKDIEIDEDVESDGETSEEDEGSITDDNESVNDLESDGETSEEDEGNNTASNDLCDRNVISDSERSEVDKGIITASNDLCEDKIKNLPIDQLIKNSCNEIKEKVDEKHIVKNTVDIENEVRLHEENGKINSESHRYEDKKDKEIDEDVESDGETSEEDEGSITASIDLCEDKNKNLPIDQIIKNNSCNDINEKVDEKHIVKTTVYIENEVRLHEENGKINSESHRVEDEKDIEIDEDVESDGETSEEDEGSITASNDLCDEDVISDSETSEEDEGSITDDNESENDLESDGETSEEDEGNNTASNDLCDRNVLSDSERSEEDEGSITASNDLCEDKIKNLPIDQLIKNSCNEIKEKVDEKHIVKNTVDIENEVRLHEENGKINSESHRYEDKKDIEIDEDVESDGETSEEDEGSINASIDLCEDKNKNLAIDQIIKNNSCNEINEKVDDKHIVKNTVYMENEVRLHEENGKINSESHRCEDEKDIEIDEDVESHGERSEEDEGSITASIDLCEDKNKNLPIDQINKNNSCNEINEKVDEKHIVKNTVDIENEVRLHEENVKINSESHRGEDEKDIEIDEDVESDGETSEEDEGSITASNDLCDEDVISESESSEEDEGSITDDNESENHIESDGETSEEDEGNNTASNDLCEDKIKNLPIDQIIKNNSCNEINEKLDEKHIVKNTVYIENEVRLHEENGKIISESHRGEDEKDIKIDEDVESDGETSEEDEGSITASNDLCDEDVISDSESSEEDERSITDDNESENDLESDGETSEEVEGSITATNDLCDEDVISDSECSEEDEGSITDYNESENDLESDGETSEEVEGSITASNDLCDEDVISGSESSEEDEGSITASNDLCEDKNKNLPIDQINKNNSCNEINEKVDEKHIIKNTVDIKYEVKGEGEEDNETDEDVISDSESTAEDEGSFIDSNDLCDDNNKNLPIDKIIDNKIFNQLSENLGEKYIVNNVVDIINEVSIPQDNGKINKESIQGELKNDTESEDDLESDWETIEEGEGSINASNDLYDDKNKNLSIDQIINNKIFNEKNEKNDEKHIVNMVDIINEVRLPEENGKINKYSIENNGKNDNESEDDLESDWQTSEKDEGRINASNDLYDDKNKNLPTNQIINNNICNQLSQKFYHKYTILFTIDIKNEARLHEDRIKINSESDKGEGQEDTLNTAEDVEINSESTEVDTRSNTDSNDFCDYKNKNLPIDQIINNKNCKQSSRIVGGKYTVYYTLDIKNDVRLHKEHFKIHKVSVKDEREQDKETAEDVISVCESFEGDERSIIDSYHLCETSEEDKGSITASIDLSEDKNKNLPIDQIIKNNSCNEINEKVDEKHIVKNMVYIENEVRLHEENDKINSESHRDEDEKDVEIDVDVESDGEASEEDEGLPEENGKINKFSFDGETINDNESEDDLESDGETSEEDERSITASIDLCEDKKKNLPIDQIINNKICNELNVKVDEKYIVNNMIDLKNEAILNEDRVKINSESVDGDDESNDFVFKPMDNLSFNEQNNDSDCEDFVVVSLDDIYEEFVFLNWSPEYDNNLFQQ